MTALENVALPLEFAGKADAFEVARGMLDEVGSSHRPIIFRPSSRAASSSAWRSPVRSARVRRSLLADEPTGNLDGKTGGHVVDLLFSLQRRRQATLILVTHDASLARALRSRHAHGRRAHRARSSRRHDGCRARSPDAAAAPRPAACAEPRAARAAQWLQRLLRVHRLRGARRCRHHRRRRACGCVARQLRAPGRGAARRRCDAVAPAQGCRGRGTRLAAEAGRISETATMRAMARRPDGSRAGAGGAEGRGCRLSAGRRGEAVGGMPLDDARPARAWRRRRSDAARAARAEGRRSHLARHRSRCRSAPPSRPSPTRSPSA